MEYVANLKKNGSLTLSHKIDEKAAMSLIIRDCSNQEIGVMIKAFSDYLQSKSIQNESMVSSINNLLLATGFAAVPEEKIIDLLRLKP